MGLEALAQQDACDTGLRVASMHFVYNDLAAFAQECGACTRPAAVKFAGVEVGRKRILLITAGIIDHPLQKDPGIVLHARRVQKTHEAFVALG